MYIVEIPDISYFSKKVHSCIDTAIFIYMEHPQLRRSTSMGSHPGSGSIV